MCKAWDDYGERKGESLKRVWGCLVDRAKTCIKGGNRSHEARKGWAVAIDPNEGLLAVPAEVGAVAHVEVEAVSDDEEEVAVAHLSAAAAGAGERRCDWNPSRRTGGGRVRSRVIE